MGVDIVLWRVRIGTFIQPVKCRSRIPVLTVSGMSLYIRALLFLLLAVYGVETNPEPGTGPGAQSRGGGSSGSNSTRGRGRGDQHEVAPRLLRSNSASSQPSAHVNIHSPHQTQPSSSPPIHSYSSNTTQPNFTQPPIDTYLSHPGSSPGLFGPSRFQSPMHGATMGGHPTQYGADIGLSELKTIMLSVQSSVQNMETRFSNFEQSLKEVKESNQKLAESQEEINQNVKELNDRVGQLETDLKSSEEKREKLEAQSRRENLRFHGIPESRDETWEETEDKVREYISKDLDLNQSNISIERAHRIPGTEKPRTVIVKFSFYKDKEKILKSYREKRKEFNEREAERENAQGGSDEAAHFDYDNSFRKVITVSEDFPSRVIKVRYHLRKFLRDALKANKNAYLKYDKLVIEGEIYEYDSTTADIVSVRK